MRKFLLVAVWIPFTIVSLIFSLTLLHFYNEVNYGKVLLAQETKKMLPKNGYQFYASLPQVLGSFSTAISKDDARPEILRQFLQAHESPFEAYAGDIVVASDREKVDFRLITAIAMCESNLGKKMPAGSYNAWGYAIYTGQDSGATFANWKHAIDVMAEYLSQNYYQKGLMAPEDIGPIYAPPSVQTGNSWAKCVRNFMDELI